MNSNKVIAEYSVIKTKRLVLKPFCEKYLTQEYVNWLNDLEVVRYSEQRHHKHTIESCRRYIKSFEGSPNYIWVILAVSDNLGHIGNINAYVDEKNRIADVGILIGKKEVWNRGYGSEAWSGVCNYLLNILKLRKVTGGAISTNKVMLRLMQKAGMVKDGRRTRHYLWEGNEVDIIHMAIFREKKK